MRDDKVDEFFRKTQDMLPAPVQTRKRLHPVRERAPGERPMSARFPTVIPSANPLLGTIRLAKMEIARVFCRAENMARLRDELQAQFDIDPVLFLRTYEPLFRIYETSEATFGSDERRPLRIIVQDGGTVHVDRREEIVIPTPAVSKLDEAQADDTGAADNPAEDKNQDYP